MEVILRKVERILFFATILFLPTQLGKHFWPSFSFVEGIRIDYLSPILYLTDLLILLLLVTYISSRISVGAIKISNIKHRIVSNFLEIVPPQPDGAIGGRNLKWLVLVVFLLIGIFLSHSPPLGFYALLKIVEFSFLGFYIASHVSVKKDFSIISVLFAIGIAFESLLATVQFMNQSSIGGIFWFFGERAFSGQTIGIANASIDGRLLLRPYGTFPHPNVLAGYLTIAMAMVISNFQFQISNWKKILFGLSLVVGTGALFLTLSRIPIILWMLIGGWLLIAKFINHQSSIANRLLIVLVFIGSIGIIASSHLPSRFASTLEVDRETITRRQELNLVAIEMVKTSPIFGVGLHNFLVRIPEFQKSIGGPLWLQPAHNIYLLILAETGIVGFVAFFWLLVKTYKRISEQGLRIKNKKFIGNLSLITLSIVAFLGMFDHYFLTLQQGQLLLAITLGIAWTRRD